MKKRNIILLLFLSIILIVFLINSSKIKFLFSILDAYINESEENDDVADIPVNPLDQFSLDLQEDEISNSQDLEEEGNKNELTPKDPSIENVVFAYKPELEGLQSEFSSSIDSLISEAANDYSSGVSSTKLVSKYISKSTRIEESSDSEFNSVLRDLEDELKENNQDTYIVEELRDYYKTLKKNKKNELLNKAKKYID